MRDYLPPHDDGHAPQLLLMDAPLAAEPEPPLRELVETVYLRRYGLPAADPVVRRTLLASQLIDNGKTSGVSIASTARSPSTLPP